jgi:hypothetical protein
MTAARQGIAAYTAVTAAYWAFMITDGALRMLVLLHFHSLGFSPVQLAYLFILYEIAGMVTNLTAGWIAARYGLASTLYAGLTLQVVALVALTQLDTNWTIALSVTFVMLIQGLSGVAKDLTKMSAKSAVKFLAPDQNSGLFRWVAILTGSKNAIKGIGFFIGAALLGTLGYNAALLAMAAVLFIVLIVIVMRMPSGLPQGKTGAKFSDILSTSANINWLSAARFFLFGARDVWFVVGIPIYFYGVLSDGTPHGNKTAFFIIGAFMAAWIILYGMVQAAAPKILKSRDSGLAQQMRAVTHWGLILAAVPIALTALTLTGTPQTLEFAMIMAAGLIVFGVIFAVNSSLHSYLILALSSAERVTLDVGFYYMANAGGRLLGTLLSGLTYQWGGLPLMLGAASLMVMIAAIAGTRLHATDTH